MRVGTVRLLSIVVALTFVVMPPIWAGEHSGHVMFTPADLQWADIYPPCRGAPNSPLSRGLSPRRCPSPSALSSPPTSRCPPTGIPPWSGSPSLSGTLHLGRGDTFDEAKTKALPAGSISTMEPKINHFGWTSEETVVQLSGMGALGDCVVRPPALARSARSDQPPVWRG